MNDLMVSMQQWSPAHMHAVKDFAQQVFLKIALQLSFQIETKIFPGLKRRTSAATASVRINININSDIIFCTSKTE